MCIRLTGLIAALSMAGCASAEMPLSAGHPARPQGPGPAPPEVAAALGPLQAPSPPEANGTRQAPFLGRGVIQRIEAGRLEIRHGAIPGFMGAMTMGFPVTEDVRVEALEVGDEILFSIEVPAGEGHRIFRVETVESPE
jgi:Cu/Ag efflux protein CusF